MSIEIFKKILEEYISFRFLLKKLGKKTIIILIILLLIPVAINLFDYHNKSMVAFSIYPEVVGNVDRLDNIIKNDNREFIYFSKDEFSTKSYDKFYKNFRNSKIDEQIVNFYSNLNIANIKYTKNDLSGIKSQGEEVTYLLNLKKR